MKSNIASAPCVQKKSFKQKAKKIFANYWQKYLFLVPGIVYLLIFDFYPMTGLQLAFKDFSYKLGIWGSPWVGFKHFEKFLTNYMFERVFFNTIRLSVEGTLIGFFPPILFALGLNAMIHPRYKKLMQTISYLPHFISTVILVGVLMQIFNPRIGVYGAVYTFFTGEIARDPFTIPAAFDWLYIGSGIWSGFGWGSILYLAALSGVSPELHEAASIDGATRFQRVIHVDIPTIIPTVTIMLIMSIGSLVGVGFEKIYLMQNDMNLRVSEVISTYIYKRGLGSGGNSDYGYSTAVGLFNTAINIVLLVTANTISRKISDIALW